MSNLNQKETNYEFQNQQFDITNNNQQSNLNGPYISQSQNLSHSLNTNSPYPNQENYGQSYRNNKSYNVQQQYPSSGIIRNDQNLAVSPYRIPNSSTYNYQQMNSHSNSLIRDKIINAPHSDKIDFENEPELKQLERQKYKEDLDYLVKLKRFQNVKEDEIYYQNDDDFRKFQNINNDDGKYLKNQKRDLYMQLNNLYNNEIHNHRDNQLKNKITMMDEKKQINNQIEYANSIEKQKILEQKQILKNIQLNDLDNYYKKKSFEDMQKDKEIKENQKNFEILTKSQNDRENQYKRKIESLNGKIYENVKKHNDFLMVNNLENKFIDGGFNEKDKLKNDPSLVEQRLQELENQREVDLKLKHEKLDNQRIYKNLLDNQKQVNSHSRSNNHLAENNNILPSYNYLSRPYASNKKAMDSIHLVKNNMIIDNTEEFYAKKGHLFTLMDHKKEYYLGGTRLNHNPITNPMSDINYNKYIERSKINNYNSTPKITENHKINAFQKAGEKIIS